jgi:hypothetical protein
MTRSLLGLCLFLFACSEDDVTRSTSPEDAGTDAPPPVDAGPRVRTIETRNPFGQASEHNLMVDGDFELTSGDGQYGWLAFGNGAQTTLFRETGGLCRSGLTCGVLTPEVDLLGNGSAPRDKDIEVSIYAKPPEPNCDLTQILLIHCTGAVLNSGTLGNLPPVEFEPDETGWCHYRAVLPPQEFRPCLYVSSGGAPGARTLVDEASIIAADGSGPSRSSVASAPPSPEMHERISRALRSFHERMPIGRGTPSEIR